MKTIDKSYILSKKDNQNRNVHLNFIVPKLIYISEAHNHGLAIGLKNDLLQIKDLLHDFDFAINESCEKFHYNGQSNCLLYQPFFDARKVDILSNIKL